MGTSRIRLIALGVAAVVVVAGVATHFLLPGYLANRVEDRLVEHGGRAEVTLRAVPALRLLAGHGDRIEISGSGLEYEFDDPDQDAFEKLDNFDEVDIALTEVTAGPFETENFRLEKRQGEELYAIEIRASARARELAEVAGEQFGDIGKLIGELAGGAVPFGGVMLPVDVEGTFESEGGEVRMVEGRGDVAGIPAGPLTRLVTNAVLSRL